MARSCASRLLAALRRRLPWLGDRLDGVSIHERLLDAGTVRDLQAISRTILAWPVNTAARARELTALGVSGLISDRPAELHAALAAEAR